jgi:hypothetical protein
MVRHPHTSIYCLQQLTQSQLSLCSFKLHRSQDRPLPTSTAVVNLSLDGSTLLWHDHKTEVYATLTDGREAQILNTLQQAPGVAAQFVAFQFSDYAARKPERERQHLCAIVYGSFRLFEAIGQYLVHQKLHLQDPQYCDRNVEYRNPHRMLRPGQPVLHTHALNQVQSTSDLLGVNSDPNDLFDVDTKKQTLEASETHLAIRSPLYMYVRCR